MILQHNIEALNSNRNLKVVTKKQSKSSEKLSSGYKINRAADNAAGLTISEGMRCMIRGLNRASDNAGDGYALLQTADGALEEIHSILQRGRELSVQAANDSNTETDRAAIQSEIDELLGEINRIADTTEFNTLKLLDGSKAANPSGNPLIRQTGQEVIHQGLRKYDPSIMKNPIRDSTITNGVYTEAQIQEVEKALNEIVPQAVTAIMNTFSSTFQNNPDISTEIGVKLYEENTSVLAYVASKFNVDSTGKICNVRLNLSVNFKELFRTGQFTSQSYDELQATIAHEMMHAFMDDALPNGMYDATDGTYDKQNGFPGWFVEGMAQTAAGGCSNHNDWVNGSMGLKDGMTEDQISAIIKSSANSLSSGSTASKYGTGYLACMYLAYLAGGSAAAVDASTLGQGLDKILSDIKNGESLSAVIKKISGDKYTSLGDFQRKFGDADSAQFVKLLLKEAGSTGSGSVLANSLGDAEVLDHIPTPAAPPANGPYKPNFDKEFTDSAVKSFKDGGSGGYSGSGEALMLQIGSLGHQGMAISIDDAHTMALGLDGISVMSFEEAGMAITDFDYAIDMVSSNRSSIGAFMNRLEHTMANLDNISENTQASESRLRDTDMAEEMVAYSTANILAQAGQSILAQANQSRQGIVQLLQ